ncbi:LamG domain-containing protein [Lysobacter silvisoli]|uniref:LamG domain-containing protein n=1 Tax=Lysobacter silvisoli TaxID=2293254 RepID=A0A371JWF0_9GAMM|nr:LamG domain-containing protein [Lysobacter silvisoli]RDZ25982.1 LamG domain-containing protein [Lysobacter silvisoli]
MNPKLVLCAFAIGALLPIAASHSQPTPVVPAWSVAGWDFQNGMTTAADVTNNEHTATAVGSNPLSWGWRNSGVNLTGGKYYTVPYSPALSFASGDFSFAAYVRVGPAIATRTLLDNRGSNGGYLLGISASRRVTLRLTGAPTKVPYSSLAAMPLAVNRWHHIAVSVARSTGTVQFYIDGVEAGTWPLQADIYSNTDAPLLIGHNLDGGGFNERLDEVHLYNRALSLDDLAVVMAPGTPLYEPGLWNGGAAVFSNNCYNYATNKRTNTFAQPGNGAGQGTAGYTCPALIEAAIRDGLEPIADPYEPSHKSTVALVAAPAYGDFHWYRLDRYGGWSHKPGQQPATNLDNSQSTISNPEYADRGIYTDFCGYFRVWSDSQQTAGHEYIQ